MVSTPSFREPLIVDFSSPAGLAIRTMWSFTSGPSGSSPCAIPSATVPGTRQQAARHAPPVTASDLCAACGVK